jgi:hypothetical protein
MGNYTQQGCFDLLRPRRNTAVFGNTPVKVSAGKGNFSAGSIVKVDEHSKTTQ